MKHLAKARVLLTPPGPHALRFGVSVDLGRFREASSLDAIAVHSATVDDLAFDAIVERPGAPRRTDRVVWGLAVEEGLPCHLDGLSARFAARREGARAAGVPIEPLGHGAPALHVVGRRLGPGQTLSLVRGVPWDSPQDPVLVGSRWESLVALARRGLPDEELGTLAARDPESALVAADAFDERGEPLVARVLRWLGGDAPDRPSRVPPLRVHGAHGIGPFTARATFGHRWDRALPGVTGLGHPLSWPADATTVLDDLIVAFAGGTPGFVLAHGDPALPSRLASVRTLLRDRFPELGGDPFDDLVQLHVALLEADAWRCGAPLSPRAIRELEAGLDVRFPERLRWFLSTISGGWTDPDRTAAWLADLPWRFEGHGGWPVPLAQLPVDGVSRAVRAVLHPDGPERMVVPFEREPADMAPPTVLGGLLRVGLRGHPVERRVRTHDLLVTEGDFESTILRVVEYGVTVSVSRHGPLDRWLVAAFHDMIDPSLPR